MSRVYVLGADHFLQNIESICLTSPGRESEAEQKVGLNQRIRALNDEFRFQMIAEEARLDRPCIGQEFASEFNSTYCNLTMPWPQRHTAGVQENYNDERATRARAYRVFEKFMFDRVQVRREASQAILVICGPYHVAGLVELFKTAGDQVTAEDTYYAKWYKGRPEETDDGQVVGHYKETHGRAVI